MQHAKLIVYQEDNYYICKVILDSIARAQLEHFLEWREKVYKRQTLTWELG